MCGSLGPVLCPRFLVLGAGLGSVGSRIAVIDQGDLVRKSSVAKLALYLFRSKSAKG